MSDESDEAVKAMRRIFREPFEETGECLRAELHRKINPESRQAPTPSISGLTKITAD